mmetsp:Transcript_20644/g.35214  ORF Transcript_20644/g.35214 Transcript_20644/m.35214 type:complete len:574 (+) Transcript_20644:17-1738(+)
MSEDLKFRGNSPTKLAFGTSGLRGLVTDITDLEAYINTKGFLRFALEINDTKKGDIVYIAGDLRSSTHSEEQSIMCAVQKAILDSGLKVVNLGLIPTPALAYFALQKGMVSIMITGSHIPFDRNGIKFNKSTGEVLKTDESAILKAVAFIRKEEYDQPADSSLFDDKGWFKKGNRPELPKPEGDAGGVFKQRYLQVLGDKALNGMKVVFYQHSAVGRDLLVDLLRELGATVYPAGRSDTFVPVDTEAISNDRLAELQVLADNARKEHGDIDAIVSTDGDSDRPMVVGVSKEGKVRFFGGDLLGAVVAQWLKANAIAVPVSTNDAVGKYLKTAAIHYTKIGSPYVVAAMNALAHKSDEYKVVGWEANGGFLVGTEFVAPGGSSEHKLLPLPTRDAALPIIACLRLCVEQKASVIEIFSKLPPRFSKADLIDEFPRKVSLAILAMFQPPVNQNEAKTLDFDLYGKTIVTCHNEQVVVVNDDEEALQRAKDLSTRISNAFSDKFGFGKPSHIDWTDGCRIRFDNNDIAHIRPSGNAPQLRIYAVADTQERADAIASMAVKEPDGILRTLEKQFEIQ